MTEFGHAAKAGLTDCEKLTVHCFRKTCGQNWANHLPMNVLKELMGHASITTTAEFYSKVCGEHEAQAQRVGQAMLTGTAANGKVAKAVRRVG